MSLLGIAALLVYVGGFIVGFVTIADWIAQDEARKDPSKADPAWLNGAVSISGALFWPVFLVGWLVGRIYVLATRSVR